MSRFRPALPAASRSARSGNGSERRSPTGRAGRGASRWLIRVLRAPQRRPGALATKPQITGILGDGSFPVKKTTEGSHRGFPALTGAPRDGIFQPGREIGMPSKKVVHIIGTGTIGEPLIGLFADRKELLGLDEVTFHKRTPLLTDRSKVVNLLKRGARLACDDSARRGFREVGNEPSY